MQLNLWLQKSHCCATAIDEAQIAERNLPMYRLLCQNSMGALLASLNHRAHHHSGGQGTPSGQTASTPRNRKPNAIKLLSYRLQSANCSRHACSMRPNPACVFKVPWHGRMGHAAMGLGPVNICGALWWIMGCFLFLNCKSLHHFDFSFL